jgi:hypothetical protein
MQDLLNLILQNITTHPDEVSVTESTEDGRTVYTISVNPEDMGRVIGKSGKVIKAIRSLAHVIAIRQDKRFRINVAEVGGGVTDAEPEVTDTAETVAQEVAPAAEDDLIQGAIEVSEEVPLEPLDPAESAKPEESAEPKKTK